MNGINTIVKQIAIALALFLTTATTAGALTYEEAFASIKAIPHMKGVTGSLMAGDNDFSRIGVTDGQMLVWENEKGIYGETEVYGNAVYKIMGELPVAEMIQSRIDDQNLLTIFARKVSSDRNRILILSDSARAGFTGAIIGYIDNKHLDALRKAILVPKEGGGTAVYELVLSF